ncbi:hypothetical protein NEOC65_000503 [Neochlamydia sp. AcF65]|nr:hypothetical protein [Neochlamydia sp. AcF65]
MFINVSLFLNVTTLRLELRGWLNFNLLTFQQFIPQHLYVLPYLFLLLVTNKLVFPSWHRNCKKGTALNS